MQSNDRCAVGLPKIGFRPDLRHSRETALPQFISNVKSLKKKSQWDSFCKGVANYLNMGHAKRIPEQAKLVNI